MQTLLELSEKEVELVRYALNTYRKELINELHDALGESDATERDLIDQADAVLLRLNTLSLKAGGENVV